MKATCHAAYMWIGLVFFGFWAALSAGAKGGNTNTIQNAAWQGDIGRVKHYLAENPELLHSPAGSGTLDAAAQNGQAKMVAFLLAQGADFNEKGFEGMTPLARVASLYGFRDDETCAQMAGVLIAHGAPIEPVDDYGSTPLLHAVEANKFRTARVLLENSTNQAMDQCATYRGANNGMTALHLAIRENEPEMVAVLLQFQPPLTVQNRDEQTPLLEAYYFDRDKIAAMLRDATHDTNTVPSFADMRALGRRIADGDESALGELEKVRRDLIGHIPRDNNPYPHVPNPWIMIMAGRMNTVYKTVGEAITQGNLKSMPLLEQGLAQHGPSSLALGVFPYAAAAGNQEALNTLLCLDAKSFNYNHYLIRPAAANQKPAVDYFIGWLQKQDKNHLDGGVGPLMEVTNALASAAAKGNQKAQAALEKYASHNPP